MSRAQLEVVAIAASTGFFFLAITLTVVFWTIHREILLGRTERKLPPGHPGPTDALVLARLPLTLGAQRRLYISPSPDVRELRYGLDDQIVAAGATMAAAVEAMRCHPEFRRLRERDERIAAFAEEYE